MPPKKAKSGKGNTEFPEPTSEFPFRVGDEVEMKSFETGYRGAWFSVKIKRIRLDRKGNIFCLMLYKDYADESEEEISAFEKDPATHELILMVRPSPPPFVKESKFNKNVHTKMCVVHRDVWEVGDLVDWWYHNCWWTAKVISVVGDGRFQLLCPAPPAGEGGVYLANSRDLRPSLRWSIAAQWTAPPSKEIGKIPCARIVWLIDQDEAAEFAAPNQDQNKRRRPKVIRIIGPNQDSQATDGVAHSIRDQVPTKRGRPKVMKITTPGHHGEETRYPDHVPRKRGRPKLIKIISPPLERQQIGKDQVPKKRGRPKLIKIMNSVLNDQDNRKDIAVKPADQLPRKRGRPKVVRINPDDVHGSGGNADLNPGDKEFVKSSRAVDIEVAIPTHKNVETAEVASMTDDLKVAKKRERPKKVDGQEWVAKKRRPPIVIKIIHPRVDTGYEHVNHVFREQSDDGKRPEEQVCEVDMRAVNHGEKKVEQEGTAGCWQKGEKRPGVKQKRAVGHLPEKANFTQGNHEVVHSDDGKRRKLEHKTRMCTPESSDEHKSEHSSSDQDQEGTVQWHWKNEKGLEANNENLKEKLEVDSSIAGKMPKKAQILVMKETTEYQFEHGKKQQKCKKDGKDLEAGKEKLRSKLLVGQLKAGTRKKKIEESKLAVKTMLISSVNDATAENLHLVPCNEIALPRLVTGKKIVDEQLSMQQPKSGKQHAGLNAQVFSSSPVSTPAIWETMKVDQAYKEALDLKVLSAYEEAFVKDYSSEGKKSCVEQVEDVCSLGRESVGGKDRSVVKAYEEALTADIRGTGRASAPNQNTSPSNRNLDKRIALSSCGKRRNSTKSTQVAVSCDGTSLETRSSLLQHWQMVGLSASMPHEVLIGEPATSTDTISIGGSLDSFSGQMANLSSEESLKDDACSSHHDDSFEGKEESGSSSELESSPVKHSRKTTNIHFSTPRDVGVNTPKSDKNELSSLKKRIPKPVIKHKVSLSRKLVGRARREVSAKRRRSFKSTQR